MRRSQRYLYTRGDIRLPDALVAVAYEREDCREAHRLCCPFLFADGNVCRDPFSGTEGKCTERCSYMKKFEEYEE